MNAEMTVLVLCGAGLLTACTPSATPKGMSEIPEAGTLTAGVPGGMATQTGAPEPAGATMGSEGQKASANATQDAAAQDVFAQRCVLCHGHKGQGNGVAAENLRPKPRNLQDAAWQKSVTDADIAAIITKGGASVGKSMMMPANPDLADKSGVIAGLVKIVRSFNK